VAYRPTSSELSAMGIFSWRGKYSTTEKARTELCKAKIDKQQRIVRCYLRRLVESKWRKRQQNSAAACGEHLVTVRRPTAKFRDHFQRLLSSTRPHTCLTRYSWLSSTRKHWVRITERRFKATRAQNRGRERIEVHVLGKRQRAALRASVISLTAGVLRQRCCKLPSRVWA